MSVTISITGQNLHVIDDDHLASISTGIHRPSRVYQYRHTETVMLTLASAITNRRCITVHMIRELNIWSLFISCSPWVLLTWVSLSIQDIILPSVMSEIYLHVRSNANMRLHKRKEHRQSLFIDGCPFPHGVWGYLQVHGQEGRLP